jgi:hypothetical protein
MTAIVKSFDGSDAAAAVVQIDALAPVAADVKFSWKIGNKVFIAKYTP